jgi:hypothetical protein
VAQDCAAKEPTDQFVPLNVPWLTLEPMLVSTVGGESAIATPEARSGPLLVKVTVNATAWFTVSAALSTDLESIRSASAQADLMGSKQATERASESAIPKGAFENAANSHAPVIPASREHESISLLTSTPVGPRRLMCSHQIH